LAAEVIKKLDKSVGFTPANRGIALITDKLGLTDHGASVDRVYQAWNSAGQYVGDNSPNAVVQTMTMLERHGNCDMKGEFAYSMIRNRPSYGAGVGVDTKVMVCQITGHTFCMLCSYNIDTYPGLSYSGIDHFGEEAVVCDGWQSDYYAPNAKGLYGRVPGIEALFWRKKIASNQITVVKVHSFHLQ
jgi:hypothetical protein